MPKLGSLKSSVKRTRGISGTNSRSGTSGRDHLFEEPENATPLSPEETRGLIPAHIAYRRDLNEAEQENIVRGQDWAFASRRDPLSEKFIKALHRNMLRDVWRWAGQFRTSERNLGIAHYEIPVALRQLLDDTKAWIDYKAYPADEIAVRLHHRLVQIHAFPNGNGRHARLTADLVVISFGRERFSWGSANLQDAGEVRRRYIAALQAADHHDMGPLLGFARS
jgi:Fic-DOC domain mobile mystery protein B